MFRARTVCCQRGQEINMLSEGSRNVPRSNVSRKKQRGMTAGNSGVHSETARIINSIVVRFASAYIYADYPNRCILFLYHALGGDSAEEAVVGGLGGRYKLTVASNRDELLDRATAPIHFWADAESDILAGNICGIRPGRVPLFSKKKSGSGVQIILITFRSFRAEYSLL